MNNTAIDLPPPRNHVGRTRRPIGTLIILWAGMSRSWAVCRRPADRRSKITPPRSTRVARRNRAPSPPLLAGYALDRAREPVTPADIAGRATTLWRSHEVLPVRDEKSVISPADTITPPLPMPAYARRTGLSRLLMKDEGLIPTGT